MPYGNATGGYNRYPRSQGPKNSNSRTQNPSQAESSTGISLLNERAGKFINFNFWGRYANLEIGSAQPGIRLTWDVRKGAQRTLQNLAFTDLNDLCDICEEVMESLKNTGTFTSSAVRVGSNADSMVEINNGKSIGSAPGIYLVIYKNIDSSNRTNNVEVYPFDNVKVYRDYDHTSGASKEDISKVGQFKKFYRAVKESAKAFTMAQAHAVAVIKHTDKLATFKALSAVAAKLGVDMSAELDAMKFQPGNNGSNQYRRPSGGYLGSSYGSAPQGGYGGGYQNNQPVLSTSIDDPIDINLSMNDITNVDMSQFK